MTARIATLIDKVDNFEAVGDQLAAILLVESANQELLAAVALKDPRLWRLKVFLERSDPWADFIDSPDPEDAGPLVSVAWDRTSYDQASSNPVERQRSITTYNIDCYGYGISAALDDEETEGHEPGDLAAKMQLRRCIRLVRNILMSGQYTYLGLRGTVALRWPASIESFAPQADGRAVQNVAAARVALEVHFNEFSPQAEGEPLELLSVKVNRSETGQLLLRSDYLTEETNP